MRLETERRRGERVKALGLCYRCKVAPAAPGRKSCDACRGLERDRKRRPLKATSQNAGKAKP